jgi:tetratricopeptide (TPR) repeat protein
MDVEVYRDSKLVQASKEFVFIQVDIDRDKYTPERYMVKSIPAILFMDPLETLLARKDGYTHTGDMLKVMEVLPRSLEPVRKNIEILASDKKHYEALMGLGAFYRSKGFADASQEYYSLALKSPRASEDRAARDDARAALGLLALGRKDYKEARKIFEQACKDCDPKNEPYMLLALGNTYYRMNKLKEARELFVQVAGRFPDTEQGRVAAENLKVLK